MAEPLTPQQEALLAAIERHLKNLGENFTLRLARENKWSPAFAQAVVKEYAKFLFIAREGGHPVSPSPMIDQAWHLHLLYTREYWSDFCPNILGFNLDHSPHTGNPSDSAKFDEWGEQTLLSYRRFFGMPNRIWRYRRPKPSPAAIVSAVILFGIGLITYAMASIASLSQIVTFIAVVFIFAGIVVFIGAISAAANGVNRSQGNITTGSGCGYSNCGSSDASSYTGIHSDSGGHHGGAHGCGGGHSGCGGGHGCGGGGCGGGGGH